jgi:acetylglutamate kinase
MQVLKVGGNQLADSAFLKRLGETIASLTEPAVIVHGGGQAIAELQERLGIEPVKIEGLRVTDAESLVVSQMVLSGQANKSIVVALLSAGVQSIGISGVDGGLLRCVKKQHPTVDLGFVGQIVEVKPAIIRMLVAQGITPVISPISLGLEGQIYNVNADEAAAAVAAALQVTMLNLISNVPGVLDHNNKTIPQLTPVETELLIQGGIIRDGMLPKVHAALEVITKGVPCARIVNLSGLIAGSGTLFCA